MLMVVVLMMMVLQTGRRGTDADKEQAAFQPPDDDCALAQLDGDDARSDGAF